MLFHGKLQNYSRAQKQNTKSESKWQEVRSTLKSYKNFHLYGKFLFSSTYSRVRRKKKKTLPEQSEFLLIRADKILVLSFMTLVMNLLMIPDKKGMLCRPVMLTFMSLNIYLITMPGKKGVMSCFARSLISQVYAERLYSSQKNTKIGVTALMSQNPFRWSIRNIKMSVNIKLYDNF